MPAMMVMINPPQEASSPNFEFFSAPCLCHTGKRGQHKPASVTPRLASTDQAHGEVGPGALAISRALEDIGMTTPGRKKKPKTSQNRHRQCDSDTHKAKGA